MKATRSTWIVSLAIFLVVLFMRLMIQGSSKSRAVAPATPAAPEPPIAEETPTSVVATGSTAARHSRNIGRRVGALAMSFAMLSGLLAMGASTALAATSVNSPGKVQADTTQLNWSGQGVSNGSFDEKCGNSADPGSGGYQNGATADNYMLWIFNTSNGSVAGNVTVTINGTDYGNNDGHQIVTPAYDPSSITDAHANFVVADTGKGSWVLTISHGCSDTVQDQVINPQGNLTGPCADPAYYATFDNSLSTVAITFRMRWYNMKGLNAAVVTVPGGSIYTTYQHWAKPGTYVSVWYKDPFSLTWKLLDREQAVKGSYDPCVNQPGFSTPS